MKTDSVISRLVRLLREAMIASSSGSDKERRDELRSALSSLQNIHMALNMFGPSIVKPSPAFLSCLETLLKEVTHSGFNSSRSKMLLKELLDSAPKTDFRQGGQRDRSSMTQVFRGVILNGASSGINAGKNMLRKMTDVPTLSMSGVAKVVLNKKAKTLTYLNEDGESLFIVRDYVPSEVKVEIREGDDA